MPRLDFSHFSQVSKSEKILDTYNNYDTILKNVETHQDEFVWNQSSEEEFIRKIKEVIME